jgi:IS30 family transposase
MCKEGYEKNAIAKAINRDKSVVYRELNRNCDKRSGLYHHDLAQ